MKHTTKFYAIVDGEIITEHNRLINAINQAGKAKKWAKIINSQDPDEIMLYFER